MVGTVIRHCCLLEIFKLLTIKTGMALFLYVRIPGFYTVMLGSLIVHLVLRLPTIRGLWSAWVIDRCFGLRAQYHVSLIFRKLTPHFGGV